MRSRHFPTLPVPRIALVTARAARDLDADLPPLQAALQAAGAIAEVVDWDDPAVDWRRFDLALLRSTWDYVGRLAEFLGWAASAARQTRLANPVSLVRWNVDKHYLGELAGAGVPVVPGAFIEPGAEAAGALAAFLDAGAGQDAAEFVVKPAVGAGSRDARRHPRDARAAAAAQAGGLLAQGRSVLLQPYLARVDAEGETALVYFEGAFSHAVRKGPLLQPGAGATEALFAPEAITARDASAAERAVAAAALAAIPGTATPLYARVDLIRDDAGQPRVLELELVEPSLFFDQAPGAAARFARHVLARAAAAGAPGHPLRKP
jgi:O-ureido-D-serine cyclo-ligase